MTMLLQISDPSNKEESQKDTLAVGIDLGTTNSVVSYIKNNTVNTLKINDSDLIPSLVTYTTEGPFVGKNALNLSLNKQSNTLFIQSIKRHMSQGTSPLKTLGLSQNHYGHKTPISVSADILKYLKDSAEKELGEPISRVVITVPAYFDESARLATKAAAQMAGLCVLRLINEPTAAALAYGLEKEVEGIYAVYDLGGGTFDVSILQLAVGIFQVLSTGGNTHLGGDDIDHAIIKALQNKKTHFSDLSSREQLRIARDIKHCLSEHSQITMPINDNSDEIINFTKDELEELAAPFIDQTLSICSQALKDAGLKTDDIKGVILVGGSTRMPYIVKRVESFFNRTPLTDIDPDKVVAYGAAQQAKALTMGSETVLLDVTPLSLGIETMGGLVEKIIPRNTPIPAAIAQEFTTYEDGQTAMQFTIVQGEREFVKDCKSLGSFQLSGIPSMVAGAPRIRVTFQIDADGLLTVTAQEKTTGIHQVISIEQPKVDYNELHDILVENAHHGAQDIEQRLLKESRIEAEQIIKALEHALKEDEKLLAEDELQALKEKINSLKIKICKNERDAIKQDTHDLAKASQSFAEKRLEKAIKQKLTGQQIDPVKNKES